MNCAEFPRVAVDCSGTTRNGFLLSGDPTSGLAKVRFLKPQGWTDEEAFLKDVLGIHGKTFFSSCPSRPDICERVTFFDRGRQRKGWVRDVAEDGRVTLLVDVRFRFPAGKTEKETLPEEIETEHVFLERWVEELVLTPIGKGWRRLRGDELDDGNGFGEYDKTAVEAFGPTNGQGSDAEKKGGDSEEVALLTVQGVEAIHRKLAELRARKSRNTLTR